MNQIELHRETPELRAVARGQQGMTLLEIMIVLAIIALVMGFLVGPRVLAQFGTAKEDTARTVSKQLANEAYTMWARNNPSKGCPAGWEELIKDEYTNLKEAKDPWGNEYVMYCGENVPEGARGFAVMSAGADGKSGTDDDIKSWE